MRRVSESDGYTVGGEGYFKEVLDRAPLAIHVFSADGTSLLANRAWDELWELDEDESSEGRSIFEDDRVRAAGLMPIVVESLEGRTVVSQPLRYEPARIGRSGMARWLRAMAYPLKDDDGAVRSVTLMLEDVTENKNLEERLIHRAFHDSLTALANRALLMDRIGHALSRANRTGGGDGRVALLFMDLDDFKHVNDSLGHSVGDGLLREVSRRLVECTGGTDTVARLGGDEFVVLIEDVESDEQVTSVVSRIVDSLTPPFDLQGEKVYVTISTGIAFGGLGTEGESPEDLLKNADIAMYRAKESGRGQSRVFESSMDGVSGLRLSLESGMRRALEQNEFTLHYQPEVEAGSGRIVGIEGLIRWQDPDRGMVFPDEFIPLAEENGLIVEIGAAVLMDACEMSKMLGDAFTKNGLGKPPTVWVNVSARQLYDPEFVGMVRETLEKSGAKPDDLGLEITETVAMDHVGQSIERTAEILVGLKSLGIKLAIDDFGTGYSSLSYLKRLPVDFLKVDRSFISGLGQVSEDEAITNAVVVLARSMGMKTIAEGIETEEQAVHATKLGCDLLQGYYFDRPLPQDLLLHRLLGD